jgi:hypothetical protein
MLESFGGQQAAVFTKGAEQDAVQQFLGAPQDFIKLMRLSYFQEAFVRG